jgi:hypothetical protein
VSITPSPSVSAGARDVTVTKTVAELEQAFASVPTTVYVVVTDGVAVTEAVFELDKPVTGVHEYDVAPEAVKVTEEPLTMVTGLGLILTVGNALTVIVAVALDAATQDPCVTTAR